MEKCKKYVRGNWHSHPCIRNTWKDGFCKQHHPDTVKARREASDKRYAEQQEKSPWRLLEKANARIAELEAELEELRRK